MLSNLGKEYTKNTIAWKLFVGTVVDNNDPNTLQRVKIRHPHIHEGIADTDLPWAIPIHALSCFSSVAGATIKTGILSVPQIGSDVYFMFLDDSIYNPICFGPALLNTNKSTDLINSDYPECWGFVDKSGNKMLINNAKDTVLIQLASGYSFTINEEGLTTVEVPAGLDMNVNLNYVIVVDNLLSFTATTISHICATFGIDASAGLSFSAGTTLALEAITTMSLNAAKIELTSTGGLDVIAAGNISIRSTGGGISIVGSSAVSIVGPTNSITL